MWRTAEFWVAVSFLVFMGALIKLGVPGMITKALDDRADAIRNELDQARRLREEAQALLAEYQQKRRQADDEAKAIIDQAHIEAEAMKVQSAKSLFRKCSNAARVWRKRKFRAPKPRRSAKCARPPSKRPRQRRKKCCGRAFLEKSARRWSMAPFAISMAG